MDLQLFMAPEMELGEEEAILIRLGESDRYSIGRMRARQEKSST